MVDLKVPSHCLWFLADWSGFAGSAGLLLFPVIPWPLCYFPCPTFTSQASPKQVAFTCWRVMGSVMQRSGHGGAGGESSTSICASWKPRGLIAQGRAPSSVRGTTWMQQILTLIYSSGDPEPVTTVPNWARVPWLEHTYFEEVLQEKEGSRLLTTHLPQPVLDTALRTAKPKVIYVARNPKDVAVSYYHFCRMAKFLPDPGSFDEFLRSFLDGTVHYGSWFEHVKGWLGCKEELGIFYITYEELHQELEASVEHLSTFLDRPFQEDLVGSIRKHCSFASMSENAMVNGSLVSQEILDRTKSQFMRKGIVGDWRNHFSALQNMLFDEKYQQEMESLHLHFQGLME
ncbi:hypothetical protein JRQ81_006511 [Phrynocephalus forsythii]|uniref:Sulfotransferase n=1 Tax=Phrynocephalus forsythii TaxID=171643 RepID=A0A9Q0XEX1_9SAUR|nr:hypothetical protein JRQ81_006511 [Phrynocephalus forsythii]